MNMVNINTLLTDNIKRMNTQTIALPSNESILTVLNINRVVSDLKKEAIKAMGMAACQATCISCTCCSRCHGNHK